MSKLVTAIASVYLAAIVNTPCFAESPDEAAYRQAYNSAERLHQEARGYQNGWTVTAAALKSAKEAADKHDFALAAKFAQQAEAFAKASVEQSKSQKAVWQDAIVK